MLTPTGTLIFFCADPQRDAWSRAFWSSAQAWVQQPFDL